MTESPSEPMRYLIQENHLSLDNRCTITDDTGVVHYKVNSTFFAMGDKLLISDANGNELIRIRQENFRRYLTYKVFSIRSDSNEHQIATIKRTGPLWKRKLEISSEKGDFVMQNKDDVASNEFILTKNGNTIAIATKDASPTKSLYWIDVVDKQEKDHAFVLAMVVILSCAQRLPGNPMAKPRTNTSVD